MVEPIEFMLVGIATSIVCLIALLSFIAFMHHWHSKK